VYDHCLDEFIRANVKAENCILDGEAIVWDNQSQQVCENSLVLAWVDTRGVFE
jgi:hypothetical protein